MNAFTFDQLYIGLTQSFSVQITKKMMDYFFEVTQDNSPRHIDSEFAKSKGFSDRIVYGMLSASFFSTLVGVYLPGKYALLQGIDISFRAPVYIDDELLIKGKICDLHEVFRQIEIKGSITNNKNITVSTCKIKVGVDE